MLYPFSRLLPPARSPASCGLAARKKRRGFNLIESAIVLGVVGLVIGGIWVAAAKVSADLSYSRDIQLLIPAINEGRSISRQLPIGDAIATTLVHLIPGTKLHSNGYMFNFDYFRRVFLEGSKALYYIEFFDLDELPRSVCIRLWLDLSNAYKAEPGVSLRNSSLAFRFSSDAFPVSPSTAKAACTEELFIRMNFSPP
jgi:hypothetical protein